MKEYSALLIQLLKGIIYKDNTTTWELLLVHQNPIRQYFREINLKLQLDEAEGYAFLQQNESSEENVPKLIEKRPLSFHVSLLCLLLRKHLLESDIQGESLRVILSLDDLYSMMKPFMQDSTNEVKQISNINTAIKKVIEEGFLRKLDSEEKLYEINRIIKAFINADIVSDSLERLKNATK